MIPVSTKWIEENSNDLISSTRFNASIIVLKTAVSYDYDKSYIKSAQIDEHGNLVMGSLPTLDATLTVSNTIDGNVIVRNDDIPNLTSQQLYLSYGFGSPLVDGNTILDLRFFIKDVEIDTVNDTVKYKAKDVLSFMTAQYKGMTNGTASEIIEAVFLQAKQDSAVPKNYFLSEGLQWNYDSDISDNVDIYISNSDAGYTMVEILQLVANACCFVMYVDYNGVVQFKKMDTDTIDGYSIPRLVQTSKPVVSVDPAISEVRVRCLGGVANRLSEKGIGGVEHVLNPITVYHLDSASAMAQWAVDAMADHPNTISGTFRADPRLELFDMIQLELANDIRICAVTDLKLTYNGAWRGEYTVRDFGGGYYDKAFDELDIYNIMTEYLASVENGTGQYQTYTQSYNLFVQYLESNGMLITTINGEPLITSDNEYLTYEEG